MNQPLQKLLLGVGSLVLATGLVVVLLKGTQAFLPLTSYLGFILNDQAEQEYVVCPQLSKITGPLGSYLIKDECTNLYWMGMDLPIMEGATMKGYTWQEAQDACAAVATVETGALKRSLFRVPTTDELLSLINVDANGNEQCNTDAPFAENQGCSFFARVNGTTNDPNIAEGVAQPLLLPTADRKYTMYAGGTSATDPKIFADGAYWSANQLDADDQYNSASTTLDTAELEAGGSVNLRYGTVNNPLYGKNLRLNVRCIANNLSVADISMSGANVQSASNSLDIDEVMWWEGRQLNPSTPEPRTPAGNYFKMGYRKNWTPVPSASGVDENDCPEGLNSDITGVNALCTGITVFTNQPLSFNCNTYAINPAYLAAYATSRTKPFTDNISPIQCQ